MSWLAQVQRVVRELADVVRPTFGPAGHDQLLQSASNAILITNSSSTILTALTPSHPIASLILHQLRSTSQRFGDGSGALLLLVEAAVDEAVRAAAERGVSLSAEGTGSDHNKARYAAAMRWLLGGVHEVERCWLTAVSGDEDSGLMREMRDVGRGVDDDGASMLDACRHLLQTQLGSSAPLTSAAARSPSPFPHFPPLAPLCSGRVREQRSEDAGTSDARLHLQQPRLSKQPGRGQSSSLCLFHMPSWLRSQRCCAELTRSPLCFQCCEAVRTSLPIVVVAPSSLDRSVVLSGLIVDKPLAASGTLTQVNRSACTPHASTADWAEVWRLTVAHALPQWAAVRRALLAVTARAGECHRHRQRGGRVRQAAAVRHSPLTHYPLQRLIPHG